MSHFTVVVIGEEHERQLAPYHEFECTGTDDEYVQDVDITDQIRERAKSSSLTDALEYHGLGRAVSDEADVEKAGAHKYGYAVVRDGELIRAVDRTNPDKKWDWYVMGGRWSGYFPLKEGSTAVLGRSGTFDNKPDERAGDQARLAQIDVERARCEAGQRGAYVFDKWREVFLRCGKPEGWDTVRDRVCGKGDRFGRELIPAARDIYQGQPAIKGARNIQELVWGCPVDEYGYDRDGYIQELSNNALVPFAVVKDGKWHAKADMGWWAFTSNHTCTDKEWAERFHGLLGDLPPETLLTMVDCHI